MSKTPKNVVAVTPGGNLTLDHIVGWYAVSSIPDAGVSSTKLRRLWIAEGLDADLIPKTRKAVHAFQVACRSVETRRQAIGSDSLKTSETRVDEVLENTQKCVYQVTRMIRDKDREEITHQAAVKIVFDKATEAITSEVIGTDDGTIDGLEDAIRDHFDNNAKKVPGAKVRAAIRSELESVNSTTIAKKLYFIPKAGKETAEALAAVLAEAYKKEGHAEFHMIPVANDEGQKALIAKHFGLNVEAEANALLHEITQRDEVRSDRLKNLVERRRHLTITVEKYKDMLDMSLGNVDEKVDLLNEALEELIVKTGSASITA